MIEEGALVPFDDDKDLEEYTTKDFRELFEANFQERENKIRENTPKEFFNALPEELQIAAKYVADGGQDLKGLFRTLAYVEEIIELDPANENDQAEIARAYLHTTQFGTAEEIEAEMQKKTLPESVELKKQLDRFNSNMFTIPIEFRDLPIITEYSRPTNGKAIYSFSLCHPVTKEEFIVYKLVNSTPEYSKKGNFKGNYFNSSYVF
jgi:hypothetical protein